MNANRPVQSPNPGLSEKALEPCRECKMMIARDATICPYCRTQRGANLAITGVGSVLQLAVAMVVLYVWWKYGGLDLLIALLK